MGAFRHSEGKVAVSWNWSTAEQPGWLSLTWKEFGMTGVEAPARAGFGLKMIGLSAGHELSGTANLSGKMMDCASPSNFPQRRRKMIFVPIISRVSLPLHLMTGAEDSKPAKPTGGSLFARSLEAGE
jgi:hypothetical protein